MKKLLLLALASAAVASSVVGQGIVTFTASGANRPVTYSPDITITNKVKFPVGAPSTLPSLGGDLNVALYAASAGTPVPFRPSHVPYLADWLIGDTIIHTINSVPGQINATAITLNASLGAPGTQVQLMVVGWTGAFADFNSAAAAWAGGANVLIGWTGSPGSGGQLSWVNGTGNFQIPVNAVTGVNGFNGLLIYNPLPEPGAVALGGLGLAVMLLQRFRRKREASDSTISRR